MKQAFTMIELIFVIVIIGILASLALPRLNATREDAKTTVEISNLRTCINDIASSYIAIGEEKKDSAACRNLECHTIELNNTKDGNFSISPVASLTQKKYCNSVKRFAQQHQLNGSFSFGGSHIKF